MLELNEKEIQIVASEFGITVEKAKEMIQEDDIAVFETFERFFYWMHDGKSEEELIKHLFEETSAIDCAEYHIFENGKTVFMYQ